MGIVIWHINQWLDILCAPFVWGPALFYLYAVSLVSAFLLLILFKKISNQEKISYHQKKIFGYLLEIGIYRDQFRRIMINQFNILKHLFLYLRYTVLPLIILGFPVVLIVLQIDNRMGLRPLQLNESFVIRVVLEADHQQDTNILESRLALKTTSGISVETPPLRIASERAVYWRARLKSLYPQNFRVGLPSTNGSVHRDVSSVKQKGGFSRSRTKAGSFNFFMNSAETPVPKDSPFHTISIDYAAATYPFLFWNISAVAYYFILTLFFGFLFKPMIRVKI